MDCWLYVVKGGSPQENILLGQGVSMFQQKRELLKGYQAAPWLAQSGTKVPRMLRHRYLARKYLKSSHLMVFRSNVQNTDTYFMSLVHSFLAQCPLLLPPSQHKHWWNINHVLLVLFLILYFCRVLGSQSNWEEGTGTSHIPPAPTRSPCDHIPRQGSVC